MSILEDIAFFQLQRRRAENERALFDTARHRFDDHSDETRTIWSDDASQALFNEHVTPFRDSLDTVRLSLVRSEEAQIGAIAHVSRAITSAQDAASRALTSGRTADAAQVAATDACRRAEESTAASSDAQMQVSGVRATLAGLWT